MKISQATLLEIELSIFQPASKGRKIKPQNSIGIYPEEKDIRRNKGVPHSAQVVKSIRTGKEFRFALNPYLE